MSDSPVTAFFKVLEASMDEAPEQWQADRFYLTNPDMGVAVWIANSAYGLHVVISGARLNPGFWWKRRLRRAVDKCLAAHAVSALKLHVNRIRAEAADA